MSLSAVAEQTLQGIHANGTYRRMRVLDGVQAPRMQVDGREVLLFAGSNYLDLAAHPEVTEAAGRAARESKHKSIKLLLSVCVFCSRMEAVHRNK